MPIETALCLSLKSCSSFDIGVLDFISSEQTKFQFNSNLFDIMRKKFDKKI